MKENRKIRWGLIAIACVVLLTVVWVVGINQASEINEVNTVPPEEQVVVPDLNYYLMTQELRFDRRPTKALDSYKTLLSAQYGLTANVIPVIGIGTHYEFSDSQTGEMILEIRVNYYHVHEFTDPVTVITLIPSEYCRFEQREVWPGDITPCLYDPDNWRACTTCGGTGNCTHCHGSGEVSDYDSGYYDCKHCKNGDCDRCYDGQIRILGNQDWALLSDEEKREADWKRYVSDFLNK